MEQNRKHTNVPKYILKFMIQSIFRVRKATLFKNREQQNRTAVWENKQKSWILTTFYSEMNSS